MDNNSIYKNFLFAKTVERIIEHSPLNRDTLKLIQFLSSWLMSNYTTIYFSKTIENKLASLSRKFITTKESSSPKDKVLIVTTNIIAYGGHTRVIENIISNFSPNYFDIYITSQTDKLPSSTVEIAHSSNCQIIDNRNSSPINRAQELNSIATDYKAVLLTTNSDDITPLLAFSHNQWSIPIYFYNLADHLFGLNITISNRYIDMSSFGAEISKEMREVRNPDILPIPLNTEAENRENYRESLRERYKIPKNATVLFSGGSSYKYIPKNGINFFEIALELINRTSNLYIIIIGPSPTSIPLLKTLNRTRRLIIISKIEYNEYRKYYDIADYYLDSLPISGFTTLLEASNRGLKIIFADQGEAYPDSIAPYAIPLNNYIDEIIDIIEGERDLDIADISDHLPSRFAKNLSKIFDNKNIKNSNGINSKDEYRLDSYTENLSNNSTPQKGYNHLGQVMQLPFKQRIKVIISMIKILRDYRSLLTLFIPQFIYKLFKN